MTSHVSGAAYTAVTMKRIFSFLGRLVIWIRPLARWFAAFPVLFVEALVIVGICDYFILRNFGVPDLFWHEKWLSQIAAGLGVGYLAAILGGTGALLEGPAGIDPQRALAEVRTPGDLQRLFVRYLAATSAIIVVACSAGLWWAPRDVSHWPLPAAALVALFAIVRIAFWLARTCGALLARFAPRFVRDAAAGRSSDEQPFHYLSFYQAILGVAVIVGMGFLHARGVAVPVSLALCVFLGVVASVYGFIRFHWPRYSFGAVALVCGLWAALQTAGGHRLPLPSLDALYRNARPAAELAAPLPSAPALLGDAGVLAAWRAKFPQSPKPLLIVLAIDGGGSRAALWTLSVLQQLDQDLDGFTAHTRLVSGASGGMVGAAAFLGSSQRVEGLAPPDRRAYDDALACSVAGDFLGPVARQMFFVDFLLPPFLHPTKDRGTALDAAFEGIPGLGTATTFRSLAAVESTGGAPSLVLAPFIVEDGRRLLISNLDLAPLTRIELPTRAVGSLQSIEFFKAFGGEDLKLSTALRLNATFPYVISATELPTKPARRVMDAGFYDEHGVELAVSWLWHNRAFIREQTGGVALIQIPDTWTRAGKQSLSESRRSWLYQLAGVLGPLEAIRNSRDAAMAFRNDAAVSFLNDSWNGGGEPAAGAEAPFLRTFVFEPVFPAHAPSRSDPKEVQTMSAAPGTVPAAVAAQAQKDEAGIVQDVALSWRLTSSEKRGLAAGMGVDHNCAERRELARWWTARGGSAREIPCRPRALACGL